MHRQLGIVGLLLIVLVVPVGVSAQRGHAPNLITEYPMPELFLRPIKYVAHTGTKIVYVRTEDQYCVDSAGQPLEPCLVLPWNVDPSGAHDVDLFSVVIPGKSLREVVGFSPRFGPSFGVRNWDTATAHDARFAATLITTFQSSAIPNWSVAASSGTRRVDITLLPGMMFRDTIQYTRDGIINRQWLRDNAGLTEDQVEALLDNDMTLHFTLRVGGAMLEWANVYTGVLIEGY